MKSRAQTDSTVSVSSGTDRPHSVASSLWGLVGACLLALLGGWSICGWLDRSAYDIYPGTLHAERQTVTAGHSARMLEYHVAVGQKVAEGQKLFRLSDEQLEGKLADKRQELQEAQAEAQQLIAKADVELEWRKRELQSEAFQTRLKIATLLQDRLGREVELVAWEEQIAKVDQLGGLRPMPSNRESPEERRIRLLLQQDAAAGAAESISVQLELCEQRLKSLLKMETEMTAKVRTSSGVDLAEARQKRLQSELTHLEQQEQRLTVISPGYGTVAMIHRKPGDLVSANDCLAELLDQERRHILVDVPSRDAADIRVGQTVHLVFGTWIKRMGRIVQVPPLAEHADHSRTETIVAVRVESIGQDWPPVPAGSQITVRIPK